MISSRLFRKGELCALVFLSWRYFCRGAPSRLLLSTSVRVQSIKARLWAVRSLARVACKQRSMARYSKAHGFTWQVGGGVAVGTSTTVSSGGSTSFGTLSALGMPSGGKGTVNMTGNKGSVIRCVYEWNDWTSSGIGECDRNDGRRYDLRLRQ